MGTSSTAHELFKSYIRANQTLKFTIHSEPFFQSDFGEVFRKYQLQNVKMRNLEFFEYLSSKSIYVENV